MPSAYGYSDRAIIEYQRFLAWYREMAGKYGLPPPVGAARMQRAFWSCRCATAGDRPFEKYVELEQGLKNLRRDGMTLPGFHGLIVKAKDGSYGVERLLSYASRTSPADAPPKIDWEK